MPPQTPAIFSGITCISWVGGKDINGNLCPCPACKTVNMEENTDAPTAGVVDMFKGKNFAKDRKKRKEPASPVPLLDEVGDKKFKAFSDNDPDPDDKDVGGPSGVVA